MKTILASGGVRNTGLRAAKAEWIASVDSDDFVHPQMLELLWKASEGGRYDIVSCRFDCVDENSNFITRQGHKAKILENTNHSLNIFTELSPEIWNKLWKKSLCTDNNIYFPIHLYYQDMATIPRILTKSRKIKRIDDSLYFYRERRDSETTSHSENHIIDYINSFFILYDYLVKENIIDRYRDEFSKYIIGNIQFHSENVAAARLEGSELTQYLRNLLILKMGFIEHHEDIYFMNHEELLENIKNASSKRELLRGDHGPQKPSKTKSPGMHSGKIIAALRERLGNMKMLQKMLGCRQGSRLPRDPG